MPVLSRFSCFALISLASLTLLGCSGATTTESAARTGALILSGTFQSEPYITNAKFSIQNKQMVVVTPQVRVVLEEVEESS